MNQEGEYLSKVAFLQHSPVPTFSDRPLVSAASMAGVSAPLWRLPTPCLQLQRRLVFSDTSQSELTSTQFPQLCPSFLKSAKGRPTPPDPQAKMRRQQ